MQKLLLILFIYLGFTSNANADLLLFGGNNNVDFLGCYDCSKYDIDSICNKYSTYGSMYNSYSIWNKFGTYGNKYNPSSPWNKYSSSNNVPVLVDRSGKFYGYFTINCIRDDAFNSCGSFKYDYDNLGDLEELRNTYCDVRKDG